MKTRTILFLALLSFFALSCGNVNKSPKPLKNDKTLTIKVAVVIEDPVVPNTGGKRMHEVCHTPRYDFPWHDPFEQMKEMEMYMEQATNYAVDFEVVKLIDADRFFTYDGTRSTGAHKKYYTLDTLVNHFFDPVNGHIPGWSDGAAYDYTGMMKYYGLDKMRNNDEIQEIWVFTNPASAMFETRLIGPGAFWCNSEGIDDGTTNKLVCVVFCNYEREIALALHSNGHRIESIMNQVYGEWNHNRASVSELNNWDKFTAYGDLYDKYEKGKSHIGLCHFPPNAHGDYQYYNTDYVDSYCDDWLTYPNLPGKTTRRINREEWASPKGDGDYQLGYMIWAMNHIPHFKGLNPEDKHLNNWWRYIFDYENALAYEKKLQSK